mmetsp:Transcript_46460/g.129456  ORF Transcript_46460/g.129456 Transcript_46460/m.129456 type:complete len:313 (+) Transcript_46460:34-972(+)
MSAGSLAGPAGRGGGSKMPSITPSWLYRGSGLPTAAGLSAFGEALPSRKLTLWHLAASGHLASDPPAEGKGGTKPKTLLVRNAQRAEHSGSWSSCGALNARPGFYAYRRPSAHDEPRPRRVRPETAWPMGVDRTGLWLCATRVLPRGHGGHGRKDACDGRGGEQLGRPSDDERRRPRRHSLRAHRQRQLPRLLAWLLPLERPDQHFHSLRARDRLPGLPAALLAHALPHRQHVARRRGQGAGGLQEGDIPLAGVPGRHVHAEFRDQVEAQHVGWPELALHVRVLFEKPARQGGLHVRQDNAVPVPAGGEDQF